MKIRFVLSIMATLALLALPVYAQHGGGHGGGMGNAHSSAPSSSMHGNSGKTSTGSGPKSVSEQLSDNTKLSSKLGSLLPAGTNLQTASQGFKNLGQFVAAVHVSHNLGIPFDQLKAKMIGPPKESLGQAIHALKPAAKSKEESNKGEKQAKQDMDDSKAS
ncbi:MAG TPA: hypothetical protein VKE93_21175 [Candidatus Angelobacter sp.]|nr:hypothetical protein [Candidatus Angelobacter sp.]